MCRFAGERRIEGAFDSDVRAVCSQVSARSVVVHTQHSEPVFVVSANCVATIIRLRSSTVSLVLTRVVNNELCFNTVRFFSGVFESVLPSWATLVVMMLRI